LRDTLRDRERDSRGTPAGQEQQQNKGTSTDKEGAGRRSAKGPLPDDWEPSDHASELADELDVDLKIEAAAFRDHAAANDRRQVDWDAAFYNWLRNAHKFRKERNGKRQTGTTGSGRGRSRPQEYDYDKEQTRLGDWAG